MSKAVSPVYTDDTLSPHKRQTSQNTSEYKWQWVTMSDYKRLQVTMSDYKSHYEWLQVTMNGYKRRWVELGMTITTTSNNLRHNKSVSYDYKTTNEVNTLKHVLKVVVLHFWWKSSKSTCAAEAVIHRCSSNKVSFW